MKTIRQQTHEDVTAWEIGVSPVGRPLMTTCFYLLDHLVIDCGCAHLRTDVLRLLEDRRPRQLLLTHCHEDHAGNARAVRDRFQVDVCGHPYTVHKLAARQIILPYQRLIWGKCERLEMKAVPEFVETDRYHLRAIHTPGHSKDHTVYLLAEKGWLFSGDLFLAEKIKYFRADENIIDEIESLRKVLTHDFEVLFCGHNPQLEGGRRKLQAKLDYLQELVGRVQAARDKGCTEPEIIRSLDTGSDRLLKLITMGNMSFGNLVRSVLRHQPPGDPAAPGSRGSGSSSTGTWNSSTSRS